MVAFCYVSRVIRTGTPTASAPAAVERARRVRPPSC